MLLIIPAAILAAGMDLPCLGAKALAMGGAFRATADDPTAIYWNPAGLSGIERSSATAVGQLIFPFNEFTPDDTLHDMNALFRQNRREMQDDFFPLGNIFAVYAPKSLPKWRFGLGAYIPTGVASTWDILLNEYDSTVAYVGFFELEIDGELPAEDFVASIGSYNFVPTISFEPFDGFSIGAGFIVGYAVLDVSLFSSSQERMMEEFAMIFQHIEMEGYSFGGNIGIQYRPTDRLRFGLTGKYESDYKFTGEYIQTNYLFYCESAPGLFPGGIEEIPPVDAVAIIRRPAQYGFGIAYDPLDKLTLALDLSYTDWSVMDSISMEADSDGTILEAMPLMWEDSYRLSFGAEYRFSRYAARLGCFYEPNPPIAAYQNLFLPDINDGFAYCAGFAANWEHLTLELSGELEVFGEKIVEPNFEDDELINIPGTYDNSVADIILSITWQF